MQRTMTVEDLQQLSHQALVDLFKTLDAPRLEDMNGEYQAALLAQPNWLANTVGHLVLNNPYRHWLTKAFRPVDAHTGRGYNTFQQRGKVVQCYPMLTMIAPSRFDQKPAYQLIYRQFHSSCGSINMVDEIRQVAPDLYLGIGTYGFTDQQRRIAYPFLLKGPIHPYRQDIGRPRAHFKITSREIPNFHTSTDK